MFHTIQKYITVRSQSAVSAIHSYVLGLKLTLEGCGVTRVESAPHGGLYSMYVRVQCTCICTVELKGTNASVCMDMDVLSCQIVSCCVMTHPMTSNDIILSH